MTKCEFLAALRRGISQLPPGEVEKQLAYYEELLDDMMEDDMTEQEATAKLGDPIALAMQILQDQPLQRLVKTRVKPKGGWSAAGIAALIIGAPVWIPVLIALLTVAVSVYAVIGLIVITLFIVVAAIIISGIAMVAAAFWAFGKALPLALLVLGGGLSAIGLSILAFIGAIWATKGLFKLTRAILRGVKSLFIGKEAS